ncbi:hypothetical protein B0J13DRAFT_304137 [Dactylonectria estremocensis]|uniref:Uncharacterized protein n=1 Tax=Dactylonectria estremocensis TaxID=1079267 RepID=A0A9P9EWZ7_9HYPO|nr:hypothetical protein B0J13DRAFT_304137 [Dactylonectria estremocensis]
MKLITAKGKSPKAPCVLLNILDRSFLLGRHFDNDRQHMVLLDPFSICHPRSTYTWAPSPRAYWAWLDTVCTPTLPHAQKGTLCQSQGSIQMPAVPACPRYLVQIAWRRPFHHQLSQHCVDYESQRGADLIQSTYFPQIVDRCPRVTIKMPCRRRADMINRLHCPIFGSCPAQYLGQPHLVDRFYCPLLRFTRISHPTPSPKTCSPIDKASGTISLTRARL